MHLKLSHKEILELLGKAVGMTVESYEIDPEDTPGRIYLTTVDPNNKIATIKAIRGMISGLGLADAKALTEKALPVILTEILTKKEARPYFERLATSGYAAPEAVLKAIEWVSDEDMAARTLAR